MDKNQIEIKLDEGIYYALTVLSKKHRPTDEFTSVFSKRMFFKANTKAFIHVMHFLFNVLDAKEFKKRFYWPIYDKNAENSFRTSCVEYYNFLIVKHNLKLMKIKAVHVVFPGGINFMKILLPFINFVTKEELQRNSKHVDKLDSTKLHEIVTYHANITRTAAKIKEIVKADCDKLKERCDKIDSVISNVLFNNADLLSDIPYNNFIHTWHYFNVQRFENIKLRQNKVVERTAEYNACLAKWREQLDPKPITVNINYDKLNSAESYLSETFQGQFAQNLIMNGKINVLSLPAILLSTVLPEFQRILSSFACPNTDIFELENHSLAKICEEFDGVKLDVCSLERRWKSGDDSISASKTLCDDEEKKRAKYLEKQYVIYNKISSNMLGNHNQKRLALFSDADSANTVLRSVQMMKDASMAAPKTPVSILKNNSSFLNPEFSKRFAAKKCLDFITNPSTSKKNRKARSSIGFLSPNNTMTKQALSSTIVSTCSDRNWSLAKNMHIDEEELSIILNKPEAPQQNHLEFSNNDIKNHLYLKNDFFFQNNSVNEVSLPTIQITSPTVQFNALTLLSENAANTPSPSISPQLQKMEHRIELDKEFISKKFAPILNDDENTENNSPNLSRNTFKLSSDDGNSSGDQILDISDTVLINDSFESITQASPDK